MFEILKLEPLVKLKIACSFKALHALISLEYLDADTQLLPAGRRLFTDCGDLDEDAQLVVLSKLVDLVMFRGCTFQNNCNPPVTV